MDDDDLRDFLLRHRRIMSDSELARAIGVRPQAVSAFINQGYGRQLARATFRTSALHVALGIEVAEIRRTWKPKEEI